MFSLTSSFHYFLYRGATDMRRSFDGLSGLVQSKLKRNPDFLRLLVRKNIKDLKGEIDFVKNSKYKLSGLKTFAKGLLRDIKAV